MVPLLYLFLFALTLLSFSCRMHPTYTERIRAAEKHLDPERQASKP
jgi:hypothetical protein